MEVKESKNYNFVLRYCFSNDEELINKWHIVAGSGLTNCINKTISDFGKMDESFKFYTIEKFGYLFGYFGTEQINGNNFLTGFFIMPEFRNKDGFKEFWNVVSNHFSNESFIVGIYSKNIRAANWLEKSGGKPSKEIITSEGAGKYYKFSGLGV